MPSFVINLSDYIPPKRYDLTPWTQVQISYSPDGVVAYTVLSTIGLVPLDGDPANPRVRNFTVTAPTANGFLLLTWLDGASGSAPTKAVQYPAAQGHGAANPSILSARYAVRTRIGDGVPLLDPDPEPFNMVRLENLTSQIPVLATPVQTIFMVTMDDIPTQRYMNAAICPGTLVAYVDGSWTPRTPTIDVDRNGNFTLAVPPISSLMVSYAWQYLSDGSIDQFVDESRQWLREFLTVDTIPDGLVPALVSYAASRALASLAARAARLTMVRAGDSEVDWSKLQAQFRKESDAQCAKAEAERLNFYTGGPETLDPTAVSISAPSNEPFTPVR